MSFICKDDIFCKIGISCKSIVGPISEAKTPWMVNRLQLLNQLNFVWRHTKVFMQNSSQWIDGELILMALHTHFLPQQQYFRVYALFLGFHDEFIDEDASFLHFLSFFSQDNEHTELTVLLFFRNSYAIFAHILQHYHDFQSNVAIFTSVVQVYVESYIS